MDEVEDSRKKRKEEFQRAVQERMTPNLRRTLIVFDIIMVSTVLADLLFMMGFIGDAHAKTLAIINIFTVAVGYVSLTTKKRFGRQVSRELFGKKDEQPSDETHEDTNEGATSSEQT